MDMTSDKERSSNRILTDFCHKFCFANQISEPIRVTVTSSTLIDVVLSSHPDRYAKSGTLHLGISDHDLIYTIRKSKLPRPSPRTIEYRSMKDFVDETFLEDLQRVPWDSSYVYEDANDIWAHWSTLYKQVLDKHAPIKKKQVRGDQLPWITPTLLREISRRNRLYKLHKRNSSSTSWEAYRIQRNKVTSMKRIAMKNFCDDVSTNARHQGEFWKKMKPLLPNTGGKKQGKIILVDNGQVLTDSHSIAESFNHYFSQMFDGDEANLTTEDFANHPSVRAIAERHPPDMFSFQPVKNEFIRKTLDDLNPKKAVGVDGISPRLLKLSAPSIAEEMTKLINHFIVHQTLPLEWKRSNLTPVFKKSEDTDMKNYRPVSVLTTISKVFERVMYVQAYDFIYPMLSPNLSGFLKGHSCCSALLKMTEDWRASLDQRHHVAAVAVDLSKAFDSVCHSLLLAKLKTYGFTNDALDLMSAYLRDRQQRVRIDDTHSDWAAVRTGVPQGSLLSPLLFNIYTNDLNYFVSEVSLRLYADDTTEYASDASPAVLQFITNTNIKKLSGWFDSNYLSINSSKTQSIAIGPSSYNYSFEVNESAVQISDVLRILGVTIDKMLTFKPHITLQLKKAYAKAAALRRLRRFISTDIMRRLYKAFILPHLEYCSPVMIGIGKGQARRLEDANYYILRTVFGLSKSHGYEEILKMANMKSLAHRRCFQSLILLFKCLKGQGPQYVQDFFKPRIMRNYNLRGNGSKLEQPSFNSHWLHNSFSYITSRAWNNLPAKVREAENIKVFRSLLCKVNLSTETSGCSCNICFN